MALINCSKCGHRVSTTAPKCPGCGTPPSQDIAPAQAGIVGTIPTNPQQSTASSETKTGDLGRPCPNPKCGNYVVRAEARFCTRCGARLPKGLAETGQPSPPNTVEGGAQKKPRIDETTITAHATPLTGPAVNTKPVASRSLVTALELAVHHAEPRRVLEFSQSALSARPTTAHGAVAAAVSMSCHAQLGDFQEAQRYLRQSREYYADHLRLAGHQRGVFLEEGLFFGDLLPVGARVAEEDPWLFLVFRQGPVLPKGYVGDTEVERQKNALRAWAQFIDDNREEIYLAMAYLCASEGRQVDAAKLYERSVLVSRKFEVFWPVDIRLIWPRVALGDCYWNSGEHARAAASWRSARSFELCVREGDSNNGFYERLALPWIEQAKSMLTRHDCGAPTLQASREAAQHLRRACLHLLEAEEFESRDEDLLSKIRQGGRKYVQLLDRASSELNQVELLDPFTWAEVPIGETSFGATSQWFRYERAKGVLFQKKAFAQCANEQLALAIASFKQGTELWPQLAPLAMMGGLQAACRLVSDARITYQTCIDRAEELGSIEADDDREQTLREVRQALAGLSSAAQFSEGAITARKKPGVRFVAAHRPQLGRTRDLGPRDYST